MPPVIFVALLWMIMIFLVTFSISITEYGVIPRNIAGLRGIMTAPLVHSDFLHLMSNSMSLLVLGTMVFFFYPNPAFKAIVAIYLFSGLLVWIFGRTAAHVGASGLSYGLAAFLVFSGLFRKDIKSLAIALLIIFIYGGMIWGVLPVDNGVSWESHLSGAVVGILAAIYFKDLNPPERPSWEVDEESDLKYEGLNYKSVYRGDYQLPEEIKENKDEEEREAG